MRLLILNVVVSFRIKMFLAFYRERHSLQCFFLSTVLAPRPHSMRKGEYWLRYRPSFCPSVHIDTVISLLVCITTIAGDTDFLACSSMPDLQVPHLLISIFANILDTKKVTHRLHHGITCRCKAETNKCTDESIRSEALMNAHSFFFFGHEYINLCTIPSNALTFNEDLLPDKLPLIGTLRFKWIFTFL